jgi:glucose/arabinose dehydrogenase
MFKLLRPFYLLALLLLITAPGAAATTLPENFNETVYASGFNAPTTMRFAPDGRLFVLEQDGKVWIVAPNGTKTEAIDIVTDNFFERGLLGIAFNPNFGSNSRLYLYYTVPAIPDDPDTDEDEYVPPFNRISRFTLTGSKISPASEVILMNLDNLNAGNHNGGALNFGADRKLYVAVGDNAFSDNAQTLSNRHGKILRINKDGSIPTDNPFYNGASGDNRAIWALGLRNPYNFTVQPGTGLIYVNDVGQGSWEEINEGIEGANYGWPETEGDFDQSEYPNFTRPLYTYANEGSNCSIIGAAFYNPTTPTFPAEYVGDYFFGDYCGDWISRYDPATDSVQEFATSLTGGSMVDIVVGESGDLFYVSRDTGTVYRISYSQTQEPPVITQQPEDVTAAVGAPAAFSCDATGSAPITFQWQRNQQDIPGATDKTYEIEAVTIDDNGAVFRCVATNPYGSDTSDEATLTVTPNTIPVAEILTPVEGTKYSGGQTISYSGTGTDAEDGTLPASAFTWEVVFHHDEHTHPFIPPQSGMTEGTFVIPTTGHTETDVWYRIHLTVRDADNSSHSVYRDIHPNLVNLTLQTEPAGLQITLDGQPFPSEYTTQSVVGIVRSIGAPSPQMVGDTTYIFQSWSDGGAQTHDINTPATDTTYTAVFVEGSSTELLFNGDFEIDTDSDKVPDGWTNKFFDGSKRVCNKDKDGDGTADKIVAHSGSCAFQTKGIGGSGKLQQTISDVVGYSQLNLSLWAQAKAVVDGVVVDVKVKYAEEADKLAIEVPAGTYEYQLLTQSLALQGDALKVKVRVKNLTTGGKARLDALQLTGVTTGSLIGLPQ